MCLWFLGATGGFVIFSYARSAYFRKPSFWTGSTAIILLTINAILAVTGFIGNKETLRTVHAYVGSLALVVLVFHAFLGIKLGLSI